MAMRVPRGYAVTRPYYQEISKGERLSTTDVPLEAYTGLPHVRVDEYHHDPVVLEPGTLVGVATGGPALGKLVPAFSTGIDSATNGSVKSGQLLYVKGSSDAADTWGLPNASGSIDMGGLVKPIGVVYQPVYSFILSSKFTNYERNVNVGVLTNYVIQIPVTNDEEFAIMQGDLVMAGIGNHHGTWDQGNAMSAIHRQAGRYKKYVSTGTDANERVVGRCLSRLEIGTGTTTAGTLLKTDVASSNLTLSTAGSKAFKGMDKVQTVPGLGLAGSATQGVPGWLMGARADANGKYYALTILIRL